MLGSQLRNALKHDSDSSSDDEKKCTQPQEHSHEEAKSHHGHADGLSRIDLKPLGAQITASHSVKNGGGTGKELPANLLNPGEEGWNKWCEIDSKTARVFVKLNRRLKINGFGFKSANDCPERDPQEVTITYLAPNYSNAKFATYKLEFDGKRWHTVNFSGFELESKQFMFDFKNDHIAQIQLGEIIFYKKD